MTLTKEEASRIRLTLARLSGKAATIAGSGWSNQVDRDTAKEIETNLDLIVEEFLEKERTDA